MKTTSSILLAAAVATLGGAAFTGCTGSGDDHSGHEHAAAGKPYPLKTCIVTDEKFEGSGMTPHEFVHEGQTIKLCCKSCLKDFEKEPAKYLKKIAVALK